MKQLNMETRVSVIIFTRGAYVVFKCDQFLWFKFRYGGFSGCPPEDDLSYPSRHGIKKQPKKDLFLSIEHGRHTAEQMPSILMTKKDEVKDH